MSKPLNDSRPGHHCSLYALAIAAPAGQAEGSVPIRPGCFPVRTPGLPARLLQSQPEPRGVGAGVRRAGRRRHTLLDCQQRARPAVYTGGAVRPCHRRHALPHLGLPRQRQNRQSVDSEQCRHSKKLLERGVFPFAIGVARQTNFTRRRRSK